MQRPSDFLGGLLIIIVPLAAIAAFYLVLFFIGLIIEGFRHAFNWLFG